MPLQLDDDSVWEFYEHAYIVADTDINIGHLHSAPLAITGTMASAPSMDSTPFPPRRRISTFFFLFFFIKLIPHATGGHDRDTQQPWVPGSSHVHGIDKEIQKPLPPHSFKHHRPLGRPASSHATRYRVHPETTTPPLPSYLHSPPPPIRSTADPSSSPGNGKLRGPHHPHLPHSTALLNPKPSHSLSALRASFQNTLMPPSVTDLSQVRPVHHPALLSVSSFPTTHACPFTQISIMAPSPLLRTLYTIRATAFARLPADAQPVLPAFATAAIAVFESDRIHTVPRGQFRIPSSIRATSPSHTVAPVPSRLAPSFLSDLHHAPPTTPSASFHPSVYTLIYPSVPLSIASSHAHRGASGHTPRSTTGISTICTRAPA